MKIIGDNMIVDINLKQYINFFYFDYIQSVIIKINLYEYIMC